MLGRLRRLLGPDAQPLPPGPRGRILFLGPFNGGIGGVERITRCFADWVRDSGYSATFVVRHDIPGGPYRIEEGETIRVLPEAAWGRALAEAKYEFIYIIGAGLKRRRWIPRLEKMSGVRVVLDLDRKRKWLPVTDVLHCEVPRAEDPPAPFVVATPDPRSTMPDVGPTSSGDYYLTAFNPYGTIKGHEHIEPFCEALGGPAAGDLPGTRLVWCYDLTTWVGRERRYADVCRTNIETVNHPRLELVEAPSRERLYELYAGCAGYVCFSRDESLGYSMLDAVALGKPLCARRIGLCTALEGFQPTDDFSQPIFGTYALPATLGYGSLFEQVPALLGAR